ncbi:MAG: hypothetical protein AAGF20_03865, partial [Pseudomonadota bacterium]
GACSAGNLTAIHKKATFDGGRFQDSTEPVGVFVDAEQRAVLSTMRPLYTFTAREYQNGQLRYEDSTVTDPHRVICAEPAPDALSAVAAQAGISVEELQGGLSAQGGLSQAVANLGVRTQTIQTLRDGFYRVCEAYMNGLSDVQYSIMLRRFQTNMIALLAIEQLTGAVRGGDALAAASSGTVSLQNEGDGTSSQVGGGNGATAGGSAGSFPPNREGYPGTSVASAVESIALALINQDYGVQLCLEYLRAGISDDDLEKRCLAVVDGYANSLEATILSEERIQTAQIAANARMTEARARLLEAAASAVRDGSATEAQLDQINRLVGTTDMAGLDRSGISAISLQTLIERELRTGGP